MTIEPTSATILVVDDDASTIDLVLKTLGDYDLIPATSGADALRVLESHAVDLILLDIMMPDMDGYQVCDRLKAAPRTHDIPVIFLTACDDEASIERAYDIGGYDYVTKPLRPRELQARVQTQLTLYHQFQRLSQQNRDLIETQRALQKSQQRYHLAMEASRDGLWDWDVGNGEVYYSPGWSHILGLAPVDNVFGSWEARIHPEDKPTVLDSLEAHLAGQTELWREDHRLRDKDDNWTWVSGRGRVVQRDSHKRALRMVGTMTDITERKLGEELSALRQRMADLVYGESLEQLMRHALDTAEHLTDSKIGFFHFVEDDEESISLQVWSTRTLNDMCFAEGNGLHYPVSQAGVWVDCIHQRRVVIHNDYAALPHKKGLPEGHAEVQRELTVPVLRNQRIVAVMGVGNKPRDYNDRDQKIVERVADMAMDFVDRQQAEERMQFMAFNDVLTGLPNRELLTDRLRQAMSLIHRSDLLLAVCYLDLDGFKPVNDRHGHATGDRLLYELGQRLNASLREGDTLARMGGDEFVVLLNNLQSVYDGEVIVHRLLESIRQPFEIEGNRLAISGSIGVTLYPMDESDGDTLLRHADHAMYQVKQTGKSGYRLFDPVQDQKIRQRRAALNRLQSAMETGELVLYFQPRVDLSECNVVSAEALLRWRDPERGLLPPGDFLPLVSGQALEIQLGEWVLRQALEQHMRWRAQGIELAVSINVSPRQIQQPGFIPSLRHILAHYPADVPGQLELELLETSEVADIADLTEVMRQCAGLGLTFSLDDFGTGYSSLSHFHRLPIDVLKIDQNFVKNMLDKDYDLDIVEGVLRLAYGLKRPVVAEGVESVEIGLMLLQLGCRYAQGFGIARPMPAEDMPGWLTDWRRDNIWHRLRAESADMPHTVNSDLNVSIFSHRHWLAGVIRFIETGNPGMLPPLDASHCQFDRWYRGIGLIRYGKHPGYPFIPPKHGALHELANELVALVKDDAGDQARARIGELKAASEELIGMLLKLRDPPSTGA